MKSKLFLVGVLSLSMVGCKTNKDTQIIWTSGYKQQVEVNEEKKEVLTYWDEEKSQEEKWEVLEKEIEGFTFEEGYLKKLEVAINEEKNNFTLVKEISKKEDNRLDLVGDWILSEFHQNKLDSGVVVPTLTLNLYEGIASGSGGCNRFMVPINKITSTHLELGGNAAVTLMACDNNNIEREFLQALSQIDSFMITDDQLEFSDKEGNAILKFKKDKLKEYRTALSGEWKLNSLQQETIDGKVIPTLNFDLNEKRVFGKDGCNNYFGGIEEITGETLVFGMLASTKMMCPDMKIPNEYHKVLSTVKSFQVKNGQLSLLNGEGEIVAVYLK